MNKNEEAEKLPALHEKIRIDELAEGLEKIITKIECESCKELRHSIKVKAIKSKLGSSEIEILTSGCDEKMKAECKKEHTQLALAIAEKLEVDNKETKEFLNKEIERARKSHKMTGDIHYTCVDCIEKLLPQIMSIKNPIKIKQEVKEDENKLDKF